ncbi:MAG: 16S rRNA (adenine(1518)-N(6)/adenine(1519)-N(6))-dimethyltransferase RsmA [Bacteroidales bacterium]|jgi:16S rRNA (adenine1518-N6/adenine1519-N6)-dimethyltransferase|nr:16S rRNA (adenine(1518)-N(6)/adenine(1519)-N(6))-dimethyltransferase RsmA [Bacteroidales bacterium]
MKKKEQTTLTNPTAVKPKKWLGQHFLVDDTVARRIAGSTLSRNKHFLEVGAGTGMLTQFLLQKNDIDLQVVEVDMESINYLRVHYPALEGKIIHEDFLTLPLQEMYPDTLTVIGNFPYNISSQILFKVLENKDKVTELVGMFQKEVALRVTSPPGNKNYGILSVLLQAFYRVEYLFDVSCSLFFPPPKVESAVIRVTRDTKRSLSCDEKLFKTVVKTAFNQRRKILRNSLKSLNFSSDILESNLGKARPEQLSVSDFEHLCLCIS